MIDTKTTVGVIGNGFVGSSVVKGFNLFCQVKFHDANPIKSMHTMEEVMQCDFVFVCLPTPMEHAEGGKCDLSIMERFFVRLQDITVPETTTIVIKSTVPIGTTKHFTERFPHLRIAHSPEFLTARSAALDFICTNRNVVGSECRCVAETVKQLYEYRFPGIPCHVMSSEESEMVKYMTNCFLMTKVLFFNEMRLLSDELGLTWDNLLAGVLSDGRIAHSHYQVPGADGDFGAGGLCFPKDVNACIRTFEDNGLDPKILKAVWAQNKAVRKNWDWARHPSAVSHPNEEKR